MSEEQARMMRDACRLAASFFSDLAQVFEGGSPVLHGNKGGFSAGADLAVDALASLGAKHKIKEKEKSEKKSQSQSQQADKEHQNHGHDVTKASQATNSKSSKSGKDEGKDKKKKKTKEERKDGTEGLKRPLSAYMLFNNFRRPTLKKEHPALTLPEVSKMIGEEWNKLADNQKRVWLEKSREEKLGFDLKVLSLRNDNQNAKPVTKEATKEVQNGQTASSSVTNSSAQAAEKSKKPILRKSSSSLSSISDDDDESNIVDTHSKKKAINSDSD
eukprot:403343976